MNQTIESIQGRRSVRSYDERSVPKDILEAVISAGNAAPSGSNVQNWRFVVVQDGKFRAQLAALALPIYKTWITKAPQALKDMRGDIDATSADPIYYSAPVIIFVVGWGMTADLDSPMVCQNIMLAARSFGLGSCWVFFGQFPMGDPGVRKALELKEGEKVYGPILLGYPKGGFPPAPPKKAPLVTWI